MAPAPDALPTDAVSTDRVDPGAVARLVRPTPRRSWWERAEQLADATGTTPARLAAGGLVAVVVAAASLWITRPAPTPPEVALPFASTTGSIGPASTGTSAPGRLVVHVAGAVGAPGVVELASGSRVHDAVAAAGGLTAVADVARINLAAPVADGERIYVPEVGEEIPLPVVGGAGSTPSGPSSSAPLDLNQADAAALDALPGIGPATAAAILDHRRQIGRFTSVDQLLDVRGIGEAKLEQIRPLVRV